MCSSDLIKRVADRVIITNNPSNQIKCEGDTVNFTIGCTGGLLNFQWQKNGTNILNATDSIYSINVNYEGRPLDIDFDIWAGAFMWEQDDQGQPFIQSVCQGYGPKGWWPTKNHMADEPDSASISITVPENLLAVSNGKLASAESLGNGKNRYQWKVSYPINNYNLAVHIGDYEQSHATYVSQNGPDFSLEYFFLKQDQELSKEKLSMVPKVLEVYEKYFGPYPFSEDGFKIVQSPYPMEHQSCVAVGRYFDDQLILHETAHEW